MEWVLDRMRHCRIPACLSKAKELHPAKADPGQKPCGKLVTYWKEVAQKRLRIKPDQCPEWNVKPVS